MGSESIPHEAEGRMGYWLRGREGERNTVKFWKKDPPYITPQTRNARNPVLNRPSKYKPPGGLYLELALKYKVKQSKNK